jgi:hypothetical protein
MCNALAKKGLGKSPVAFPTFVGIKPRGVYHPYRIMASWSQCFLLMLC